MLLEKLAYACNVTVETKQRQTRSHIHFFQGFQEAFLRNVFVSHEGQDVVYCGNSSAPCRSVRFAVNISNSGDVIFIDHAQGKPYKECEYSVITSKCLITLNKSLSFIGIKGKAVLQCRRRCDLFKIKTSSFDNIRMVFMNLVMTRSRIVVRYSKSNFEVVFEQCVLKNNDIGVYTKHSMNCLIQVSNSSFEESSMYGVWMSCLNFTVRITATVFNASPVALQTTIDKQKRMQKTQIFISNCGFDGRRKKFCAELLSIKPFALIVNITVQSSRFSNHYGICSKKRFSTLLFWDSGYRYRIKTSITFNKLLVENNNISHSAVRLIPLVTRHPTFEVKLSNSIFRNNTGALFVSMSTKARKLRFVGPTIQLSNNTFIKNLKGYGNRGSPAIRFDKVRSRVTRCRFLDNMSGSNNPYAAVVVTSRAAVVRFVSCYYENSQTNEISTQFYGEPDSRLWLVGNNTFNIKALKINEAVFIHMPSERSPGLFLKGSLHILCPRGYVLSSDSERVFTGGPIQWSYLYISCEQCPPKTYSLKRGDRRDNITNKLKCQDCPRGGLCEGGQVTARPNFWGYRRKDRVSFLACPPNYFCDSEDCNSYDGCYGNRTGALCGQCPDGMSEPLFDTKCKSNRQCTSVIFWPGVLCFMILYLIFFLYQEEITRFIRKGLSLKLLLFPRIRNSDVQNSTEDLMSQFSQKRDTKGSGFLKIIFYYYQTVHLFRNCVGSRGNQQMFDSLEKIFSRSLNLIVVNVPSFDCPFQNLRPVQKAAILHSVGHCLLALVGLVHVFIKCFSAVKMFWRRNHNQPIALERFETVDQPQRSISRFSVRTVSAFTYISLLMYSSTTQLCLSLLHCVPVRDGHVLFIDGTIKCYQTFQYFLLGYVCFSVIPFCLVPVLGSYLLKVNRISVSQFCIACVFPLPFCCFWMYIFIKDCSWCHEDTDDASEEELVVTTRGNYNEVNLSRKAILRILLGPFRSHKPILCFPSSFLPWEGFLIFRRLVLIIVLTFTYDNRLRMMLALIICVAILVSHMYVHPFISASENIFETLSLSTLVIVCGFTLVKALYQGEDFSSTSGSLSLLSVFGLVENILIILPAAIIIFVVVLSLLIGITFFFRFCIRVSCRRLARLCGRQ